MYSSVANFLVSQGIGEATDVLLIDEELCIGCDNCERACADIHDGLSRLDREAGQTYAHLHVPTSCRHCEHPYCMTDCPPDAIHRGPDGEVFIDETCIGCGNCQRYCPYGVIRMDSVPPEKPSILLWLLFGTGPGPGEPDQHWKKGTQEEKRRVAQGRDQMRHVRRQGRGSGLRARMPHGCGHPRVAGRFPVGGAARTGAPLVAEDARGKRSSAAKHEGFLRHADFRWLKIGVALSLASVIAFVSLYMFTDFRLAHAGGTWLGYTLGTIGALLIVWLTLLGLRKRAITEGYWSLKAWTSAHVYLGLSLIVIVTLHTGFQFGWNIHTLAYALMIVVILSGIFGIIMYARLPSRLSENRGDNTQQQMLEMIRSLDSRLHEAAQPLDQKQAAAVRLSLEKTHIAGGFWRRLTNSYGNDATNKAIRRLARLRRADKNNEALGPIAELLGRKAAILSRARRQIQLKALLEVWLYIHVPLTFALLAALTAHIVSVFFYW